MTYRSFYNTRETPQTEPIPGENQVPNSAGGYTYTLDDFGRLDRFLVLGSEWNTYYTTARKLSVENAEAVRRAIATDGKRVVARIAEISEAGRAPKNSPALFALAMAASFGDEGTRRAAFEALPRVARIPTHLFEFASNVEAFRGWGRGLRKAVASWYTSKDADDLAFHVVKYRERNGWSHRDLLRLSHPVFTDEAANQVARFAVGKEPTAPWPRILNGFLLAQETTNEKELIRLISEYRLPMEAVPNTMLTPAVLEALLPQLGITALIRSLAQYTSKGVFGPGTFDTTRYAVERLTNKDVLKRGRVHPIQLLSALRTYSGGRGIRGKGEWTPVADIVDALDSAFYLAFDAIEPTGKRIVLGLDISGSMGAGNIAGVPGLTPREATAAMSMVTYKTEQNVAPMAFATQFVSLADVLGRARRLDDVVKYMSGMRMGGTDCSLPMTWALENNVEADAFIVYTDSETWYNHTLHPIQALRKYRQATGIPAKLIVVGMTATNFTIADPEDSGSLDVVGFDSAAPAIMADFIR